MRLTRAYIRPLLTDNGGITLDCVQALGFKSQTEAVLVGIIGLEVTEEQYKDALSKRMSYKKGGPTEVRKKKQEHLDDLEERVKNLEDHIRSMESFKKMVFEVMGYKTS